MNEHLTNSVPIGSVIKAWRVHRGLKPAQLAEASGVSRAYVSLLEGHQIKQPGSLQLNKVAQGLNVPLAALVNNQMPPVAASPLGHSRQVNDPPMLTDLSHNVPPEAVGERIQQLLTTADLSDPDKQRISAQILDLTQYFVQRMTTDRQERAPEPHSSQEKLRTIT